MLYLYVLWHCRAINAEVVGVSVDSKFSHLAWTKLSRKYVTHIVT